MDLMPHLDVWAMIREATPTVKVVLALLAAMSVLSWAVILHKLFTLLPAALASRAALAAALAALEHGNPLTAALALAKKHPRAPLAGAAQAALAVLGQAAGGPPSSKRLQTAIQAADLAGTQTLRGHERGIGILAACSGAAPFIGLFGTVWGVMHAFHALGLVQTQALTLVAPGIAEALVATALGLAVAVPASVAFNAAVGAVDGLERDLEALTLCLAAAAPEGEG
ncbi:protein TolQ [Desulfovibrio sulfodismutans]|uniref:Protein TolQ n=1 Tax=Desulfolutivibrio sulfodismutans TaxID=63561 RepID=A0A7K3NLD8_9BACT|nr:MotA/TolQ/ExbB proton channel family protein [Desulfolutivibrio sulfodismutans]NDY56595.1 protein TolQ [Desulfolutivibrio sulfodismutans]QLA13053.1 protein TolQ [Desulfolutivibrio sulfodismutans DSM 3696]